MTLLRMAASYRRSGELIRLRIIALRDAAKTAEPEEKSRLEQRIRDLSALSGDPGDRPGAGAVLRQEVPQK